MNGVSPRNSLMHRCSGWKSKATVEATAAYPFYDRNRGKKMVRYSLFLMAIFVYLPLVAASENDNGLDSTSLSIVVTDIPPWGAIIDGRSSGLHLEVMKDLAAAYEGSYELGIFPYARAVRKIEVGKADLGILFDTPASHEHSELLVSLPPVAVYMITSVQHDIWSLSKLDKPRIGRLRLATYGPSGQLFDDDAFVIVNAVDQAIVMLQRGRLNALVSTAPAFIEAVEKLGGEALGEYRGFKVGVVKGGLFLSKKSVFKVHQLKPLAVNAVNKHWAILEKANELSPYLEQIEVDPNMVETNFIQVN